MSKNSINKQSPKFDYDELVSVIMIFAMVSPFLGYFIVNIFGISFDNVGTYGDFIGGSTVPFLTTITILYIYKTNNIQKEQLKVQNKEFHLLQNELEITKEALHEQNKTIKMQRFENSFFIQINELRETKKSIVEEYNETLWGEGDLRTYKDIMSMYQLNFYNRLHDKIRDLIQEPSYIGETNSKLLYESYGNLVSAAIDESGIYKMESIMNYIYHIERSLKLIYQYRNTMDEWEIAFYIEHLSREISKVVINLVLFNFCLHGKINFIIKELKFEKEANDTHYKSSKIDFELINYILYEKSII